MAGSRLQSVDALRGLVMIVMALDHTREYFSAAKFQPDDLTQTTVALFFTRWVTHICAPVFMFTAGLGAFLWLSRGRTIGELSRFLWKRGLWLVILELTALRFAMYFSLLHGMVLLTILWALGWSMVALGFLVWIPIRPLAAISIAVIALHNLADKVNASQFHGAAWVWNILHQPGIFTVLGSPVLLAYPLAPWIFVMAAGYCFGPILQMEAWRRRWWMVRMGCGSIAAFLAIRAINVYGDPVRWSRKIQGMTVLSFLRITKYPPSLDFLLITLGAALLIQTWLDGCSFSRTNPLIVFGRVPLFYFLLHFFIIHLLTIPFALVRYGTAESVLGGPSDTGGYELWVVYAVWIGVVAIAYPACLWFSRLKERRGDWWLSYL